MSDKLLKRLILGLAIVVAAGVIVFLWAWVMRATPARADGCNPTMQTCGKGAEYVPDAATLRRAPVAYTFSAGPRRGSVCGEHIPTARCNQLMRGIKAGMKAENARRARESVRSSRPIRETRDSYLDERGRRIIDDSDRRRDRYRDRDFDCKPEETATSRPRLRQKDACAEARKLWSLKVIEKHGGSYGRVDMARRATSDPHPQHEGAWRDVCTFSAIPCRKAVRDD